MRGARFLNRIGFTFGYRLATVRMTKWMHEHEVTGRLDLSEDARLRLLLSRARKTSSKSHPKDLAVLQDEDFWRLNVRAGGESFAQGFQGALKDGKLLSSDFGFRLEEIRKDLPVLLWYGTDDVFVPCNHGVQIAKRIGESAKLYLKDETHASLVANWEFEALKELVASM
jgi:pimeloyl-ACP methyl ester carboxylesterase